MKHKDGHFVDILSRAEAFFNEKGKAIRMIGTHTDISDRKQAEEKYRKLVENMNSGVAIYQPINDGKDFKLIDFNKAAEKITNTKKSNVVGSTLLTEFPNMDKSPLFKALQEVSKSGKNKYLPPFYYKDDQREGWRENFIYKLPTNEIVAIFNDVTERKDAEINLQKKNNELKKAKEKAEESDRLKSAFLANMSHEIRTPMNGILGFANLLKDPRLNDEEQQEYIEIINKAGARMLNIINDIVSISQIEAGQTKPDIRESNINEQIEYIYTFFKPEVEAKGIQLFFKNSLPSNNALIKTDREKVFAVLTNLVKNAIKYTNQGAIEFGYEKKDDNLEFFIKDSGVGIPQDRQKAIFERFVQADIEDKMARQGAGLGLSISKAYVEMLGGKIWVESEIGKGSTFYFSLPYNSKLEEKNGIGKIIQEDDENNKIKNLKILIAEDDETSEILISTIVKEYSREIIKARTGIETVEMCRKNPDINLILMDIQMPGLNGYEATRQIRQFNKDVIIIAQTAFGFTGDRKKAIEAGCNDYISKPIQKEILTFLIQKHIKYL